MTDTSARTDAPRLSFGPDDEAPAPDPRLAKLLRAVELAEKCFEMARRSAYPGERDAAISRGIAIIKKHKLRIELFEIPGQDGRDLEYALKDARITRDWWASTLQVGDAETIYDAKRRAFDQATSEAAARDRHAGRRTGAAVDLDALRKTELLDRWPSFGAALNALRARRVEVQPAEDPARPGENAWLVPSRGTTPVDEWQLRELADEVCG